MNEFDDGVAVETGEVDYTDFDDTAEGAAGLQNDEVTEENGHQEADDNVQENEAQNGTENIPNDVWKASRLRAEKEEKD